MATSTAPAGARKQRSFLPPLPREHGAWFGLGTACLLGALAPEGGPSPGSAAAALGVALLFASRGPAEPLATGRGTARLWVWLGVMLAGGTLLLALAPGLPVALSALAVGGTCLGLLGHAAARRAKLHRTIYFEAVGLFAIGFAAPVVAAAGGTPLAPALALGALVALYLTASVPYVRLRVRPRELRLPLAAAALLLPVAGGAAALGFAAAGLMQPAAALAFLPALGRAAWASRPGAPATDPRSVGLQESVFIALFVATLVLAERLGPA